MMSKLVKSGRVAPIAAVTLGLLTLAASLANVPLEIVTHQTGPGGPVVDWLTTAAVAVSGVAVGTVLAARRPRNPIGWLLLAFILAAANPADLYVYLDYRMHHGTLPLGGVAVVFGGALPIGVLIAILLWVFPDGHLPPGRWRPVFKALAIAGVLLGLAAGLIPGIAAVASHHIQGLATGNLNPPTGALALIANVTNIAAVMSLLAWLVVQVPSYRRSGDERRHQLKWLYSGAIVFVLVIVAGFLVPPLVGKPVGYDGPVINDLIKLASALLVVCIGVAVLKYRLYEIDRIISRTLAYAIVTGLLIGVYAGVVLLATRVLSATSPVAVAGATLAAAALFNPLRRWVQQRGDRRFNRARYDADKTVTAFAARLQDAVDLDTVQDDLASVVHTALEPAHLSVWISPRG
jgi:MFS family permease